MKGLTETERFICENIWWEIHRLSLRFSYEMLNEGYTFLCPYKIEERFYKKWEEYARNN